ncbi:AMP-binding protein [Bacillus sp. T3]|uniref:AMP-binding protein n=1 Tax=Bacillus sp. T3 TaxID=467262 RepID=UPI00298147AA|nr:AMP-binding protein [Bacillus sp. T3]
MKERLSAGIIKHFPPLSDNIKRSADDLAAVLFTSGTEGNPKGVMLTHNNIISSERAFAASLNLSFLDVIFMPAPVAHASGFHHGVTASFMLGAKVVLQDIFNPDNCLEQIDNEGCTCGFGCTPVIYDLLRVIPNANHDISSMRFFLCGGAPVPRHMVEQGLKAGFKILSVYGSTESVPHTGVSLDDPIEKIIHTDGTSFPGIEIRVVDEFRRPVLTSGVKGEEASRGPNVFVGYLKEPELTERVLDDEGWYYSGDLCTMDTDGYIRINGRKKDIIIRGGENISSNEIERILHQHPNVYDVAVIGIPDPRLGERTCAFVVLHNNEVALTLEEIKSFFAEMKVSKYKYPERVEIVDSLPRTETGKVKKYLLREIVNGKQEASESLAFYEIR